MENLKIENNVLVEVLDRTITCVEIPNGVTSIGKNAFFACRSLESITIPNSVTSIGYDVFFQCEALHTINLSNSLISIGEGAFIGCKSLKSISLPNTLKNIDKKAFSGCKSLENIEIPNSVTSIGDHIFFQCFSLTKVIIPNSVTSIGDHAFFGCHSLKSIIIPNSIKRIESSVFSNCEALSSITIPSSVTSIGDHAFCYCTSLLNIDIPNSVTSIGECAFIGCTFKSITIPDSVTSIEKGAFSRCGSLRNFEIPNSVTDISASLFDDCKLLSSVTIPSSVASIGDHAFSSCISLTTITIPSSVTSIADYAFSSCTSLNSIIIPNSVSIISHGTFYSCKLLRNIEIPSSVTSIEEEAFSKCQTLMNITIPSSVTNIGNSVFQQCESLISIEIPSLIPSIGDWAFNGCTNLKKITFNAECINREAFKGCNSLKEISIPGDVKKIDPTIFGDVRNLKYGTKKNTTLEVIRLGKGTGKLSDKILTMCPNLKEVFVDKDDMFSQNDFKYIVYKTIINNLDYYDEKLLVKGLMKKKKLCKDLLFSDSKNVIEFLCQNKLCEYEDVLRVLEDDNLMLETKVMLLDYCNNTSNVVKQKYEKIKEKNDGIDIGLEEATFEYIKKEWKCTKENNKIIFSKYIGLDNVVVIPSSIDGISSYVFKKQAKNECIEKIIFSHGIKELSFLGEFTVNDFVFKKFTNLKDVYFPDSLEKLDIFNAFLLHGNSISIYFTDVNNTEHDMIIVDKTLVHVVNDNIENLIVPDGVTRIGCNAAQLHSSLKNIELPNSMEVIGDYAFIGINSLVKISIPEGIKSIGDYAFNGCESLIEVYIPDGIQNIGDYAFDGCNSLGKVNFLEGVTSMNDYEYRKSLENIEIIDVTLEYIQTEWKCSKEDNKIIFSKYIGKRKTVTIPRSIDGISSYVFDKQPGNDIVQKIIFSNGIKELYFLVNNQSYGIFGDYKNLKNLYYPDSLEILDATSHFTLKGFYQYNVSVHITDKDNKEIDMLIVDKTLVYITNDIENLIVPDGVKRIGDNLAQYHRLSTVELPSSVITIGKNAFLRCSLLKSIKMSEGIKSIGEDAFNHCESLTSIDIPDSVEIIGNGAFAYCRLLTDVKLSSNLITIENYAFQCSFSVETIFIPASVLNIGRVVFSSYSQKIYTPLKDRPEGWSDAAFNTKEKIMWGHDKPIE